MESLTFLVSQLIIDNQKPKMSFFKTVSNESFSYKDTVYIISCEVINDRFFWIYAKHGNSLPYSDEVVDTNNSKIIKNLRKKEHAELNHQVFAIYDDLSDNFYTSKSKKKFLDTF